MAISSGSGELAERLQRWVESELISPEQAERVLAAENLPRDRTPAGSRASLVAEALGYVGGVLVLVGAATVAGRYWSQIAVGGQLGVVFGAAGLLLATGAGMARRTDVGSRLRSVSWLLSAALVGTGLALLGDEALELRGETTALLAAGGTAAYAAALWWRHRGVLQQAALLAALAAAAGSAAAHLPQGEDEVAGLAVWGVGAAWALLGWGGAIAARRPAYVLGGAGAIYTARLRRRDPARPRDTGGTRTTAILLAAGVAVAATIAVLTIGA